MNKIVLSLVHNIITVARGVTLLNKNKTPHTQPLPLGFTPVSEVRKHNKQAQTPRVRQIFVSPIRIYDMYGQYIRGSKPPSATAAIQCCYLCANVSSYMYTYTCIVYIYTFKNSIIRYIHIFMILN